MSKTLALVGNPNCGKTTLFNELTGSTQYVGNWPGVTVEKKGGKLKGHGDFEVMDLPGVYSLSPYTLEEVITRDYLIDERPSVIVNIVDATNLERNLYLTTQILELGIPVVVALNMMDVIRKNGDEINIDNLTRELGCPVYPIEAVNGSGLAEMLKEAVNLATTKARTYSLPIFKGNIDQALKGIETLVAGESPDYLTRWLAIKVFERDEKVFAKHKLLPNVRVKAEKIIAQCEDAADDDAESIITNARYEYIGSIIHKCIKKKRQPHELSTSDKIDKVLTNRILALPIFFLVMWAVYFVSIQTLGDMSIGWMEDLFGAVGDAVGGWMEEAGVSETLQGLVLDGIIGGVGAVLGFVPQIMILFFFLSFLEDCGYMARVAFIMDRIFRRFGLSGKSFIPMLIGSGCSVPGIMASRTIENEQDRKMTIMLTPFIPCSAKMPVFVLFAAALFPEDSWVGPSMYFWGIAMVVISGILLKKTAAFGGKPAPFVMELPQYRMPTIKGVMIHMWERARSFIVKAGTIIFVASALVWFLQTFDFSLEMVDPEESMLAAIGMAVAPIFSPMGFGTWQAAFAAVSGFLAKEVVVSTFAILAGLGEATEEDPNLIQVVQTMFTPASAYAFMIFTLLASPCFAAIGAIRREMGSWKWTFAALAYQTGLAYVMAVAIYQIGSRF
ncbi:MAG: ferrous iron transport protein B [Negativicutes bacterium]|nr:ferrous iron transport protein B [Negativicutes bacterium]